MFAFSKIAAPAWAQQLARRMKHTTVSTVDPTLSAPPRVHLRYEHTAGGRLVLNRRELLTHLANRAVVAEIGVGAGRFSEVILREAEPHRLHLVDSWASQRYGDELRQSVENQFAPEIMSGQVSVHRTDSRGGAALFPSAYFDWIYIDTGHSYELTRDELRLYSAKVKGSGVIAGHDYSLGNWPRRKRYGVIEAVHEFCVQYRWRLAFLTVDPNEGQSFAIVRCSNGCGIGEGH